MPAVYIIDDKELNLAHKNPKGTTGKKQFFIGFVSNGHGRVQCW